ncbi:HET-domain-containing protein [Cadophora sp. DSE1049]|nr:HET-domain-containing protein [Cadophora sp. DSE1049]
MILSANFQRLIRRILPMYTVEGKVDRVEKLPRGDGIFYSIPSRMSGYKHNYDVLRNEPAEFRLVTIHSGSSPSPISASLGTYPLKHAPPYEALSYVWGPFDDEDPDLILLDEHGFVVTSNLLWALYSLRRKDADRVLWIDAICIDQDDLEERSSQVQLMRDIYKASTGTVVWLGDELPFTNRTFDLLKSVSAGWLGNMNTDLQVNEQKTSDLQHILMTDAGFRRIVQRGVYGEIGQRDFWTRIWVVQEVALSSNVMVQCGNNEVDWQLFSDTICEFPGIVAIIFRSSKLSTDRIQKSEAALNVLSGNLDEASNMAMAIPENELDIGGLSNIDTFSIIRELLKDASNKIRLSDILALLRRSRSTDPRDMIYGLLGLVPNSSIKVDYSHATTRDVYLDLVHRCLVEEKSLDIITLCRKMSSSPIFPSWVPDWTEPWVVGYGEDYKAMDDPNPPPLPLILKYGSGALLKNTIAPSSPGNDVGSVSTFQFMAWCADALVPPSATVDKINSTLTARGICIDIISSLGDWTYRGDDDGEIFFFEIFSSWEDAILERFGICQDAKSGRTILDVFDQFLDIMIDHISDSSIDIAEEAKDKRQRRLVQRKDRAAKYQKTNASYVSGGSIVEAFIRTVVVDTDANFQRLAPAKYEEFWDADLTAPLAWGLETYALTFATNRRLFITDDGHVGLAPIRVKLGDQVCILYGCSVPLVLREEHGVVKLVGEAYVHGLMEGKAVNLAREGTLKEDEWVIR